MQDSFLKQNTILGFTGGTRYPDVLRLLKCLEKAGSRNGSGLFLFVVVEVYSGSMTKSKALTVGSSKGATWANLERGRWRQDR